MNPIESPHTQILHKLEMLQKMVFKSKSYFVYNHLKSSSTIPPLKFSDAEYILRAIEVVLYITQQEALGEELKQTLSAILRTCNLLYNKLKEKDS